MKLTAAIIGIVLALSAAHPALCQQSPPTITGQGIATIEKQPQIIRLHLEVSAQGKSLKDALTKLKERREKTVQQFTTLGAIKESVDSGAPKVAPGRNDQQRRMEMMVRARLQSKPAAAKPEQMVKVSSTIKAEWKLDGMDPEAILLRAREIQDQIESLDLAGTKADQAASPEQQEEMEENQVPQFYNSNGETPPGEPVIVYVSRISPEETAKGLTDAFARAQSDAQQLATAAKVTMGTLVSLSQLSGSDFGQQNFDGPYAAMMYQYLQQSRTEEPAGIKEAMGTNPGKVSHRIRVTAAFSIQP